jgi:hypothetical protein
MDLTFEQYLHILRALLEIPVRGNLIESLHCPVPTGECKFLHLVARRLARLCHNGLGREFCRQPLRSFVESNVGSSRQKHELDTRGNG